MVCPKEGLLSQWLNFKLFGITYLVGKIKFKLLFFRVHWLSEKGLYLKSYSLRMGLEPKTSYSIGRGEGILRVNVEWGKGIFFFNLDWVFFCFVLWSICRDSKLFEIEHVFCISLYTHIILYIYHMI